MYKKINIVVVQLLFATYCLFNQHTTDKAYALRLDTPLFNSALQVGGEGEDYLTRVGVDQSGNKYIAGIFNNSVDFNPEMGVDTFSSLGSDDIYVSKYDSGGNYLWTQQIGSTQIESLQDMEVSNSGELYLAGYFEGSIDFDPGPPTDIHVSNGSQDAFITKFEADGSYAWTKTFGGGGGDYGFAVSLDENSETVYLTGSFVLNVDFDPTIVVDNKVSEGVDDIFVTKLTVNGDYLWTKTVGSTNSELPVSIAVSPNGEIYLTGVFRDSVDFDPGIGISILTSIGNKDIFITSYTSDGELIWGNNIGGTDDEEPSRIKVFNNQIYLTGAFKDSVDFDPSVGVDIKNSNGSYDIFLTEMDPDGNYIGSYTAGGINEDRGTAITLDQMGTLYLGGYFYDSVDFDPTLTDEVHTSFGDGDIFITMFKNGDQYFKTLTLDGNNFDYVADLQIDLNNNLILGGFFYDTIDIDPSETSILLGSDSGSADIFLLELTPDVYHHINNLNPNLSAIKLADLVSIDDEGVDPGIGKGESEVVRLRFSELPLADVAVEFDSDLEWSTVSGEVDLSNYKSYVHNLRTAPGVTEDYTLYVPKSSLHNAVHFCPSATSLDLVSEGCTGGSLKVESDPDVSVVTINNQLYWAIEGVSGSGGLSIVQPELTSTGNDILTLFYLGATFPTLAIVIYSLRSKTKYLF